MSETVIVALISLVGTLFGTFAGIITSGKITNYRIAELEKQVEKHNNLVERMYIAEGQIKVLEEKQKDLDSDFERMVRNG